MNRNRTAKEILIYTLVIVSILLITGTKAKADFVFGEPMNPDPNVLGSGDYGTPCVSSDGLELYFSSGQPGSLGSLDIWVAKRSSPYDSWGVPMNPGPPLNSPSARNCPYCLSNDDLELYFASRRPGGYGDFDIWLARRETRDRNWEQPINLGPKVNGSSYDDGVWVSSDGLELYFHSNRAGGVGSHDIWVSKRTTIQEPWSQPENLGAIINSSARDAYPCLSADGLILFFSGLDLLPPYRPGGYGGSDIWMSTRPTVQDDWEIPVNLGSIINSPSHEEGPRLSFDGTTLYFYAGTGWNSVYLLQASIEPIVDLNGDDIVDAADMCIIVDNWGTDNSLCDIGPIPWGDGIVDVQDLIVLAEHLFEEIPPAEEVE